MLASGLRVERLRSIGLLQLRRIRADGGRATTCGHAEGSNLFTKGAGPEERRAHSRSSSSSSSISSGALCGSWRGSGSTVRRRRRGPAAGEGSGSGCLGGGGGGGGGGGAAATGAALGKKRCYSNESSRSAEGVLDGKVQKEIMDKCESLHSSLVQPLNDRLHGPLERSGGSAGAYRSTKLPFVFLLGNHSSGKSSFINYVLGRTIQTAGVAPTDDSFTIIAPGPSDIDQDGPALVGDPDMGFNGLRQFGPTLIHHTGLKIRSEISTDAFMMVDSPGMIDSPISRSQYDHHHDGPGPSNTRSRSLMDRGYDFEGVVRWFAERADVILLFFDPDKPGTTGETLSILTNSLPGMDHKLYIILNKADQFQKIHDFARAYGSLCWNLSKVIQRKDLPRIYTMCLPVKERYKWQGYEAEHNVTSLGQGLQDLENTRNDVKAEVMKAPKRRVDNVITRLTDSVHLLQVHATVLQAVQAEYSAAKWRQRGTLVGVGGTGALLAAGSIYITAPVELSLGVAGATAVSLFVMQFLNYKASAALEQHLIGAEGLSATFHKVYARELAEGDEYVRATWARVEEGLRLSLKTAGLANMGSVRDKEMANLDDMLSVQIPQLRRKAAPAHSGMNT